MGVLALSNTLTLTVILRVIWQKAWRYDALEYSTGATIPILQVDCLVGFVNERSAT
jgi:hypothetical protein